MVELALDWEQRAQGLMYRREMAADAGMLFLYEIEDYRSMWMKNTFIPLDMLFIDGGGGVVGIRRADGAAFPGNDFGRYTGQGCLGIERWDGIAIGIVCRRPRSARGVRELADLPTKVPHGTASSLDLPAGLLRPAGDGRIPPDVGP